MITNKDLILDISVNLARLSEWILSESEHKQMRVDQFLEETEMFIKSIHPEDVSPNFQSTLLLFDKEFKVLLRTRDTDSKEDWAEKALTWGNILQHRAKLA